MIQQNVGQTFEPGLFERIRPQALLSTAPTGSLDTINNAIQLIDRWCFDLPTLSAEWLLANFNARLSDEHFQGSVFLKCAFPRRPGRPGVSTAMLPW